MPGGAPGHRDVTAPIGARPGQRNAVEATGRGGRVAFVGFGATEPTLSPSMFIQKQLALFGSFVFPLDSYDEIVGFVRRHNVPLEAVITHRLPLEGCCGHLPSL